MADWPGTTGGRLMGGAFQGVPYLVSLDSSDNFFRYNFTTDAWESMPDMPTTSSLEREFVPKFAFADENYFWAIGDSRYNSYYLGGYYFDPSTNTWVMDDRGIIKNMTSRYGLFMHDGKNYSIGTFLLEH